MGFKIDLVGMSRSAFSQVEQQLPQRAIRASMVLKNSSLEVLRGSRSGRLYGSHRASAPGEPPAVKSGTLRNSWRPVQYGSRHQSPAIESGVSYAGYMENGTPGGMIAPRPFADKIIQKSQGEVSAIYAEPFNISL